MKYTDELLSINWKRKRINILKRDGYKCTVCGSKIKIEVHHQYYVNNKKPWQYPDDALITLCHACHYKFHTEHEIEVRTKKSKTRQAQKPKTKHEKSLEYIASIIKKREDRKRRFYNLHLKKFEKRP